MQGLIKLIFSKRLDRYSRIVIIKRKIIVLRIGLKKKMKLRIIIETFCKTVKSNEP